MYIPFTRIKHINSHSFFINAYKALEPHSDNAHTVRTIKAFPIKQLPNFKIESKKNHPISMKGYFITFMFEG